MSIMAFIAETGSNHAIVMDGAPEGGGKNLGPRPMEMVLVGTAGCTAYDVVVILKKSGQDVAGCEVKVTAERAETDPKVFTKPFTVGIPMSKRDDKILEYACHEGNYAIEGILAGARVQEKEEAAKKAQAK